MSERKRSDEDRQKEVDRQLALMKAAIGDQNYLGDSDSEDSDDSGTLKHRSEGNSNAIETARQFLMDDTGDEGDNEVMMGYPFPANEDTDNSALTHATSIGGGSHKRTGSGFFGWGTAPSSFVDQEVNLMDATQARASFATPNESRPSMTDRIFGRGQGPNANLSFPAIWNDANQRESEEFIQESSKSRRSFFSYLCFTFLWLIALGALAVFVYYIYDYASSLRPAEHHSEAIKVALVNHGVLALSALDNPSSAQATALQWIVEDSRQNSMTEEDPYLVQRYSLAVLYYSTRGDHWVNSEGWVSNQGYCEWYGVSCLGTEVDIQQHHGNAPVFDINLSSNQLRGTIPTELNAFQDLYFLDLKENHLEGTIPNDLGGWTGLRMFSIAHNGFYGSIPKKLVSTTPDLRILNAAHNGFTGSLPSEIGGATNLREVHLEFNSLNGHLPDSLRHLDRVETLHLGGNRFGGSLPSGIYDMARLETLYLHDNFLTGNLSSDFAMLSHLELLTLNQNRFAGTVPNVFTQMRHLQEAHFHGNELSGTMPPSVCALLTQHRLSFLSATCAHSTGASDTGVSCGCCTDCL